MIKRAILLFTILCPAAIARVSSKIKDQQRLNDSKKKGLEPVASATVDVANTCAIDCFSVDDIPEQVRDFFIEVYNDVFRPENSTNIRRIFNLTMLEKFCGYAKNVNKCVKKCSNGKVLTGDVVKFLGLTLHVCADGFLSNVKCYREVYEHDICESMNTCMPYKNSMITAVHQIADQVQVSHEESAHQIFNNLCQYIICGNKCRSQKIVEHCGTQSNEVLLQFYRHVVTFVKGTAVHLYQMFTGKQLTIPDTCDQI